MTRRRVLMIVTAVTLALFGMIVIITYVNNAENRAQEGDELVNVLVATEEIEANTPATELTAMTNLTEVPPRLRQDDAVRDLDNLGEQVTVSPVRAGEQIVQRQFGNPDSIRPQGGGGGIDEGKEIVSITLEAQRAVGGQLTTGDLVSVIVSTDRARAQSDADVTQTDNKRNTTGIVLNGVPVTAVTGGVTEEDGAVADTVTVSLEVDGSDAERIVFGMEHGTVWLTRNGENPETVNGEVRAPDNIYDSNAPEGASQ